MRRCPSHYRPLSFLVLDEELDQLIELKGREYLKQQDRIKELRRTIKETKEKIMLQVTTQPT